MGSICNNHDRYSLSPRESAWLAATMLYVLFLSVLLLVFSLWLSCSCASSNSSAGSETSAGVLTWWMQAMLLYPEVQAKAQAELDAVVGRDRVPTFADQEHLPYIGAMVTEVC